MVCLHAAGHLIVSFGTLITIEQLLIHNILQSLFVFLSLLGYLQEGVCRQREEKSVIITKQSYTISSPLWALFITCDPPFLSSGHRGNLENMEGDGGRQGPSPNPHDRSLKRSASDSSLQYSNSHQLLADEESASSTPVGLITEDFSSMLAAATSAGELLQRFLRQRTNPPNQHDLLLPRLRGQHYGASSSINSDQVGHQNHNFWESADSPPLWQPDLIRNNPDDHVLILLDPAFPQSGSGRIIPQVNDPRLRSRLAWEVRDETAGGQGSTSRIQYPSQTRFPGNWRLLHVVYVPDEDDENAGMRLDIDCMSYEELLALGEGIGDVNTGLSQEVITERLRQRKYNRLATGPKFGEESCCICQEEYADDEEVGKLDCEHEYHVACIRQWLEQKNACPVCKKTALSRKHYKLHY